MTWATRIVQIPSGAAAHRMACAGCEGFQLAESQRKGPSIGKQIVYRTVLGGRAFNSRRAIAEGDLEKLESLIRKLDNVPALDGRMRGDR